MQPRGYENIYHNNHNVFILGAGFSVDAGLPTVKNFIKQMRLAASSDNNSTNREIIEGISSVLRWRLDSGSAAHRCKIDPNNIEELFSLIDGDQGGNGRSMGKKETMQKAIVSTLSFCAGHNPKKDLKTRLSLQSGNGSKLNEKYLADKKDQMGNQTSWILPVYDAIAFVLSGNVCRMGIGSQSQKNTIITAVSNLKCNTTV